ncbi:MAG: hypothetical protein COY57_03820 [Flavobacteriales bacterium CG_4_10_14_0_8_um_filter_32_5]|nr:MAG: hypothetical protein COY57_03820 [Flavobacteriales bacterium CG_4_10_14_0_8_um_filter_32_5]
MRKTILVILLTFTFLNIYSQNQSKEIETTFYIRGNPIKNVSFFVIDSLSATPLKYSNNKLILSKKYLTQPELKLLAIYKNHKVEFTIMPYKLFYLKIFFDNRIFKRKNTPFKFKYLFKKVYTISQGFEYVEIVTKSKKTYLFNKE